MKILFVSAFLPALGTHAGALRCFMVARGMSARHTIDVLSFIDSESERARVPALEEFCRSVTVIMREQNPAAGDLLGMEPRHLVTEYRHSEMADEIRRRLVHGDYDLAQFEYLQSALLAPAQSPIPLLFTHHEVQYAGYELRIRHERSLAARLSHAVDWMRMLHFELDTCRRFDRIITVTEEDRDALLRFAPELPVVVNHTGVDCEYYAPQEVSDDPYSLVFVGYYRHSPNVDAVEYFRRDVLPLVWKEEPSVRLSIVGGGVLPAVERLADDPRVIVTGWVPDYRPCVARGISVVPVRLGRGIRHKVLEAWAMGRPVVSTTLGAAGTGAVDGVNVRIGDTPAQLAGAIIDLIHDATLRRRLGTAGREIAVRRFDWSVTLKEHEQIYQDLATLDPRQSPAAASGVVL